MSDAHAGSAGTLRDGVHDLGGAGDDSDGLRRDVPRDGRRALRADHGRPLRGVQAAGLGDGAPQRHAGGGIVPPGAGRADGHGLGPARGRAADGGPRFDGHVEPGGYEWWYVDGVSHDGSHAITVIAFVGSVFSPYYAWSGRESPEDHVSINVCLYGPRRPWPTSHWAMTERDSADLERDERHFRVGPSEMRWDDGVLTVEFDERAVPLPLRLKGTLRLRPHATNAVAHRIAEGHQWRPIAPTADIEVEVSSLGIEWRGHGYHDTNHGKEGLEDAFRHWNWSRATRPGGGAAILYDVVPRAEDAHTIALRFDRDGRCETFDPPPLQALRRGLWGMTRAIQCDEGTTPRIERVMEDAPFYTRAAVRSRLMGEDVLSVHESLDGDRFGSAWVKGLLPFRMPRRTRRPS